MTVRVSLLDFLNSEHPQAETVCQYLYGTVEKPLHPSRLESMLIKRAGKGDVLMELDYIEARIGKNLQRFDIKKAEKQLVEGTAIGHEIVSGPVKLIMRSSEMNQVKDGDVLVTDKTDPDWEPIMKRASAIVTNQGNGTCHTAIIARELGIPAVVGAGDATDLLKSGRRVKVSCAEGEMGFVYSQYSLASYFQVAVSRLHIDYSRSKHGAAAKKTISLDLDARDDETPDFLRGGLTCGSAEADRRQAGHALAYVCLKKETVPDAMKFLRKAGILEYSEILNAYKLSRGLIQDNRVAPLTEGMIKRASAVRLDGESVNEVAARESVTAPAISRSVKFAMDRIGDAARVAGFH